MGKPSILICTVGTSLLANLRGLDEDSVQSDALRSVARAFARKDFQAAGKALGYIPQDDRVLGAEINSISSLAKKGFLADKFGLFFFHSDTPEGFAVAGLLKNYYGAKGHFPVEMVPVRGLQDKDPKRFRNQGLRELARRICAVIRDRDVSACAINATGGYKAQVAIAVLLGQALYIPVYYKHERFDEIIPFPPMPVSLDFSLWLDIAEVLEKLSSDGMQPFQDYRRNWRDSAESLVEFEMIDKVEYFDLSPAGAIFHESMKQRYKRARDVLMPPPVPPAEKKNPVFEDAGWPGQVPGLKRLCERVTLEVPFVAYTQTVYYHPQQPEVTRFKWGADGIWLYWSDGTRFAKTLILTRSENDDQRKAAVLALNEWLNT